MFITEVVKGKHFVMEQHRFLLKLLGPFLWLRMASKRMASHGCCARDEDGEDKQHRGHQQYADQEEFAPRVAKLQGPPEAIALRNKHCRIVGIVVKEASRPVPLIIAENGVGAPAIS